jgi:hypothetical protein
MTTSGVWSIYLEPKGGMRVLDGEDTSVTRAREMYALAVTEAAETTTVELVTPSGRIARSSAGAKPAPRPLPACVAIFDMPRLDVTPLEDVAVGLTSAGWNVRRVHETDRNLFGQPCIEIDYDGGPDGLIDRVARLDEALERLECIGWTVEARYGPNCGACLLVVGIVVVIA